MRPNAEIVGNVPEFKRVSPDDLLYDPENPRFGDDFKAKSNQQDQIQKYLFGRPNFASELVDSFLENGFIEYEPLVVRPVSGDKWLIVEGNRRLAAIKHIRSHPLEYAPAAIQRLDLVPVITFPSAQNATAKNNIRVYLGVRHLFGFREWPPYSKALFLDAEINRSGLPKILKEMRLTKDTVRRLVVPLRLLLKTDTLLANNEDFWVLAEALTRTGTKQFISLNINPDTYDVVSVNKSRFLELLEFLYGKKVKQARDPATKVVSETREVKLLAKVLVSDKAYKVLAKSRNLEDAAILVDTRAEGMGRLHRLAKSAPIIAKQVTEGSKSPEAEDLRVSALAFAKAAARFLNKQK